MLESFERVALLLALTLKRSGKTRMRVTDRTLRSISKRKRMRVGFLKGVGEWLEDFGVTMIELDRGGIALISASALEGAPVQNPRKVIPEWKIITDELLYDELGIEPYDEDDED